MHLESRWWVVRADLADEAAPDGDAIFGTVWPSGTRRPQLTPSPKQTSVSIAKRSSGGHSNRPWSGMHAGPGAFSAIGAREVGRAPRGDGRVAGNAPPRVSSSVGPHLLRTRLHRLFPSCYSSFWTELNSEAWLGCASPASPSFRVQPIGRATPTLSLARPPFAPCVALPS